MASIATGGLAALYWQSIGHFGGQGAEWALATQEFLGERIASLDAVLIAFPLSVLALVVVSLLSAPPSEEQANAI